ncbi:MAG: hypothetical protein IH606_06285 [Burkholderiales bacterium]|nr:hypothetical protein [Burkholderiales bacterium]
MLNDDALAASIFTHPSSQSFTHPTSAKPETPTPADSVRLAGASDTNLAASIYDHATSKPTPATEAKTDEPKEPLAESLDGPKESLPKVEVPANIKALRDAASGLYDAATPYADAIVIDREDGVEPAPEALAAVNELRLMAADLDLAPAEASEVATLARSRPTPEVEAEWTAQAAKRLLDTNNQNVEAADRDLELARKLVQRDPTLPLTRDERVAFLHSWRPPCPTLLGPRKFVCYSFCEQSGFLLLFTLYGVAERASALFLVSMRFYKASCAVPATVPATWIHRLALDGLCHRDGCDL